MTQSESSVKRYVSSIATLNSLIWGDCQERGLETIRTKSQYCSPWQLLIVLKSTLWNSDGLSVFQPSSKAHLPNLRSISYSHRPRCVCGANPNPIRVKRSRLEEQSMVLRWFNPRLKNQSFHSFQPLRILAEGSPWTRIEGITRLCCCFIFDKGGDGIPDSSAALKPAQQNPQYPKHGLYFSSF